MSFSTPQFKNVSTLMIQGCTSDAGKSVVVAGLCRWLRDKGVDVAPFKPQNMALNSAVTPDGGEIGRAQALQAEAAGLEPTTDMNPILLKPSSDVGAQVIVHGKVVNAMQAREYHDYKKVAMQAVLDSHARLVDTYSTIVVEGAGSPAEINLREGDIANMGFAEAVDCPVVLIADIDRGGVFAHLVGTLDVLAQSEQDRIVGFVINKFRGDIKLLEPGLDWLEERTGKPVLGVLPYLPDFYLDAEDAITTAQIKSDREAQLKVVVPVLPRISNHTDFDALRLHPGVDLEFVPSTSPPPPADLIILPGSKNVISDLTTLYKAGWQSALDKHLRYGGKVLGICGGYQMLGHRITDPHAIESKVTELDGFNYLSISTELHPEKQLINVAGHINTGDFATAPIHGYEIHCGVSSPTGPAAEGAQSFCTLNDGREDGAISADGQVAGTYLHGLFDRSESCNSILIWAGLSDATGAVNLAKIRDQELNRLAHAIDEHLDDGFLSWLSAAAPKQASQL